MKLPNDIIPLVALAVATMIVLFVAWYYKMGMFA